MKIFARVRDLMLVAAVLIAAGWRAEGQTLNFSVTSSATTVLVSNSVTFTISITNLFSQPLVNLVVTDSLPSSVQITSITTDNPLSSDVVSSNSAIFSLAELNSLLPWNITVTALPTAAGLITNTVTITTPSLFTNGEASIVVDITNVVIIANLGVTLSSPSQPVIINDFATYGIIVTNAGPDTAPQVMLTNTLPPGSILEGIFPARQTFTTNAGGILIFNLGDIGGGNSSSLMVTVSPTNAGVLTYYAAVGSASVTNISTLSTLATNSFTVFPYITNVLVAVTNSGQVNNFQNGLEEQSILLTNISTTNIVSAARVSVSGLPKRLYNAVGTNNGNPYVTYTAPLATPLEPGQSVTLLMQYYPHGSFAFSNSQLQAYPVPIPNLTPPATTTTSTNINITGIFKLADGNMLIEFPATTGQVYAVVYSDNVRFSNAMIAPPAIVAPANYVQWIDYGPPTTVSAPTDSGNRFYRVIQNP
jgi:uncharacterized repeat protein (TIGR01451 family)